MIVQYLIQQGLPNKTDAFAFENVEYALLCLDSENWNKILKQSMIDEQIKLQSNVAFINEIETALRKGESFNDLINKQFKQ